MEHKSYDKLSHEYIAFSRRPSTNFVLLHEYIAFSLRPSANFVEQVLENHPHLLVEVNDYGDTPLHVAAKEGLVAIVKVLIEHAKAQHHGDPEAQETAVKQILKMKNNDGNTALHEAAKNHSSTDVVKLLMREDPDFPYYPANNCGETPLYIAASVGSLGIVVEMLQTSTLATYKYKGPNGLTILHVAVTRNHPDITRKILEKKHWIEEANENEWSLTKEVDENGWTPLHYAAYYGHHLIVKLLVEFDGSSAYMADRCRKMTALHLAAGQGHYDIIDTIIFSCPACIQQIDVRGWNYVHFAMCNVTNVRGLRRSRWPNYLLNAKDVRGNTPLLVLASISQYTFELIEKETRREFIESTKQCIRNQPEQFHLLKQEVSELSRECWEPYRHGVVHLSERDFLQHCSVVGKDTEKYLVVNALIATVTFTAGLTLPGGYIQEESNKGTAVLIKSPAFKVFVISDVIALLLSVLAVWFHIYWQTFKAKNYLFVMIYAHFFTGFAVAAMIIAFVTGTYAILRPSLGLAITITMVGLSFFLIHAYVVYKGYPTRFEGRELLEKEVFIPNSVIHLLAKLKSKILGDES